MTPSKQRIYPYTHEGLSLLPSCFGSIQGIIGAKALVHGVRRTKTIHIEEAFTGKFLDKFNVKCCIPFFRLMSTKMCMYTGPSFKASNTSSRLSDNAITISHQDIGLALFPAMLYIQQTCFILPMFLCDDGQPSIEEQLHFRGVED